MKLVSLTVKSMPHVTELSSSLLLTGQEDTPVLLAYMPTFKNFVRKNRSYD